MRYAKHNTPGVMPGDMPNSENRSISRILFSASLFDLKFRIQDLRFGNGVAIIHLVQLLPVGSSDLPGGRSSFATTSGGQPW